MSRKLRGAWGAGLVLALALGVACGSEPAKGPSGAPMAGSDAAEEGGENRPPALDEVRIEPGRPTAGDRLRAVVEASDPDGDPVRLRYAWTRNGREWKEGRSPASEGELEKGDRIELAVVASDGSAESRRATASVRVRNRPPVVHGVYLNVEDEVDSGGRVRAGPEATDPDGDELDFEYAWLVNGKELEGAEGRTFSAEGLRRGDRIRVRVVADDGEDRSAPVTSRPVDVGNSPPRITELPEPSTEGGVYRYDFEASDPDGDPRLRYRLAEAPEGMTIDPVLGVARWEPALSQVGEHAVEVVVADPHGASSRFRFQVTVNAEDAASEDAAQAPPAAMPAEGS